MVPVALFLAAVWSMSASAQAPRSPDPSPPKRVEPIVGAKTYLERHFGLSKQEADARLQRQADVETLSVSLAAKHGGSYLGAVIDHQPAYGVLLVFDRDVTQAELNEDIPPSLRPYVKLKRSRYTATEIEQRQRELVAALGSIPFSISYDYRTDKFELRADRQDALEKIPASLRSDVIFHVGGAPVAAQTGVQPGDEVYGGWIMYDQNNADICTMGYSVRLSDSSQALLSASTGHCGRTATKVNTNNHFVTLPVAVDDDGRNSTGDRSYDMSVMRTTGITSGPWAWYWNNLRGDYKYCTSATNCTTRSWANVHPDYNQSGSYFYITGAITGLGSGGSNPGHPVGSVRCKSGKKTGITCGLITTSSVVISSAREDGVTKTSYGYVEYGNSDQMVVGYFGDSGGPVFTQPVYSASSGQYEIKAAGITTSVEARYANPYSLSDTTRRPCISGQDGVCPAYYMPIDRINDKQPMTIITANGLVSP